MLSGAGTWVCGEQMLAKSSGCGSTSGTGTQAPCWLCRSLAWTGETGTGHGAAARWGSRGTGKISADPGLCTIFGILRLIITGKKNNW